MQRRAGLAPGVRVGRVPGVVALVALVGGCSHPSGAARPETATVEIVADQQGRAYRPARLEVVAGTEVRWVERDTRLHDVTADDHSFASDFLQEGETFTVRFNEPGTYRYHCTIHPDMTGEVIVR